MTVRKFEGTRADLQFGDEFSDGNDRSRPRYKITMEAPEGKQFSILEHWGPMYSLSADKVRCTIWREEPDRCCTCANDYPVSVEQIREFVKNPGQFLGHSNKEIRASILNYIDNGPPNKPTAEEVATKAFENRTGERDPLYSVGIKAALDELRKAGYLSEDA